MNLSLFKVVFLFLAIIFAASFCAQSQSTWELTNENGKILKHYEIGDEIFLYETDKKLNSDTVQNVNTTGTIVGFEENSFILGDYKRETDYYLNGNKIKIQSPYVNFDSTGIRNIPLENIAAIGYVSNGQKIGRIFKVIGFVSFFAAPLFSMNFQDLTDFNVTSYLRTASFGVGCLAIGYGLTFSFKNRKINIKKHTFCNSCGDEQFKIGNGSLKFK